MKIPLIGLGTWDLRGKACTRTVEEALDIGYCHIDTAAAYDNHAAVGKALKNRERSGLFITSKLALEQVDDAAISESIESACRLALKELGLDYLDLYLIHWPDRNRPLERILEALHLLKKQKLVRHVGVSNYTKHHMEDALNEGLQIEANQVEFHPYLNQVELLQFCKQKGIRLIAYRPFGKGLLLKEKVFKELGKKYQKTPGQIILRWLIEQNIPVIPKASSLSHLKENFALFDFALERQDIEFLSSLNRNQRFCKSDADEFNY